MRITEDCRGPNRKLYHADRIDEVILFSESYMKGYDSKLKLCNRGYFGVADMVIHLYISVCKEVSLSPKFCDGFVRWLTRSFGPRSLHFSSRPLPGSFLEMEPHYLQQCH